MNERLLLKIFNTNEFKSWVIKKRWFGDKSLLSGLDFDLSITHFEQLTHIFLLILQVKRENYSQKYFIPLIKYENIKDHLEIIEINEQNVEKLIEISFTCSSLGDHEENEEGDKWSLVEAEYLLKFWKIFIPKMAEITSPLEKETLLSKLQEGKVSLKQLGEGNTTNLLFLLEEVGSEGNKVARDSIVIKSYKIYSRKLEPKNLDVLMKNGFKEAPKLYGSIKINDKVVVSLLEHVPNVGNLGSIYWNELNDLIFRTFSNGDQDYSTFEKAQEIEQLIMSSCKKSVFASKEIGLLINNMHEALLLEDDDNYALEVVNGRSYLDGVLRRLQEKLNILEINLGNKSLNDATLIRTLLAQINEIILKLHATFSNIELSIQAIHQDLHAEQILYDIKDSKYKFYFLDFEGDPQLSFKEKQEKHPIEKDLASFMRSFSYIKFNTFLGFIEQKIKLKNGNSSPESLLKEIILDDDSKYTGLILVSLTILNKWEKFMMDMILKPLTFNRKLMALFIIERALNELNYEILFRPNKCVVPLAGLKKLIEENK